MKLSEVSKFKIPHYHLNLFKAEHIGYCKSMRQIFK